VICAVLCALVSAKEMFPALLSVLVLAVGRALRTRSNWI